MALPSRARKVRYLIFGSLAVLALGFACSRYSAPEKDAMYEAASPPPAPPPTLEPQMTKSAGPMGRALAGKSGGKTDRGVLDDLTRGGDKESADAPAEEKPAPARMVHYDGSVRLRVTDPRKTLETAAAMATEMGGFVEQQNETMVMMRVPVERVREAFGKLLGMGDVLAKSLTASDITDAFTASELRLKTMRASRDRLIALLASVRDEEERLQILGEIRRLTEEIDSLDLQVKTLAKLAAYSRVTLEVQGRETRGVSREDTLAAFRWIDELSPFRRDAAQRGGLLKLKAPAQMVVLDEARHWIAESADGVVIWTSKRDNAPRGTNDFWASAIAARMGPDFAEAKRETAGAFDFVTFVDAGSTHYRYKVGVHAAGDTLEIIEIYYPTPEHETRYAPGVNAVIPGGAS